MKKIYILFILCVGTTFYSLAQNPTDSPSQTSGDKKSEKKTKKAKAKSNKGDAKTKVKSCGCNTCFNCKKIINIQFDQTGKLVGTLPEKLRSGQVIRFQVTGQAPGPLAEKLAKMIKEAQIYGTQISANTDLLKIYTELFGIDKSKLTAVADTPKITDKSIMEANYRIKITNSSSTICCPEQSKTYDICNSLFLIKRTTVELYKCDGNGNYNLDSIILIGDDRKLQFSLVKEDLYQEEVIKWFTEKGKDTNHWHNYSIEIAKAKKQYALAQKLLSKGDSLLKCYDANILPDISTVTKTTNDIETMSAYIYALQSVYGNWIRMGLWYTGGKPMCNPFKFVSPKSLKEPDTLALIALRFKLGVFQKEYMHHNSNRTFNLIDSTMRRIAKIEKTYYEFKKKKAANDSLIKAFVTTKLVLDSTFLYLSRRGGNDNQFWMRHHDASNKEKILNPAGKEEYLENDRVLIISHNLKNGQSADLTIKVTHITNDENQIDEDLTLRDTTPGSISQLEFSYLMLESLAKSYIYISPKDELNDAINALEKDMAKLYILQQQEDPYMDTIPRTENKSVYHSEVANDGGKMRGPFLVNYYFNNTGSAIAQIAPKNSSKLTKADSAGGASSGTPATYTYRVNRLYSILPFVGYAYSVTPYHYLQLNSAGNAPASLTYTNPASAFVGIKVAIRPEDIRSTKFFWCEDADDRCLFWSRLNLEAGIAIPSPLNSFFTGAGLDLWPGVDLNCGAIFQSYTWYDFLSTQYTVQHNTYKAGFYIGISTDPTFVATLAKLLNLQK